MTRRLSLQIRGAVQGVGFRPTVYRVAVGLGLAGWVANTPAGVEIDVEGDDAAVDAFVPALMAALPPRAAVHGMEARHLDPAGARAFEVRTTRVEGAATAVVLPDIATCPDCLRELLDPGDRRFGYPFINCTNCGPRFSIITSLPYDRERTTMAGFTMCRACRAEYDDPGNRRFHAQPNACPACGPHVELWDHAGARLQSGAGALAVAAAAILEGRIVAVKGVGGFHLVCDARNEAAVRELRRRKRREEKPLAVMFPDLTAVSDVCRLGPEEARLLASPEAPIVLLDRPTVPGSPAAASPVAPSVAPGNPSLGVLLPYAPLHHLLLRELGFPVVATSGNLSDEPIATDEHEALARLAGIADAFLFHDRDIVVRCDDSVVRTLDAHRGAQFVRRARGYTPRAIKLSREGPGIVATGGYFKNTVCVARADEAFVSQHVGELDNAPTCEAHEQTLAHLLDILQVEPAAIAHDLHPDFHSTRHAVALAQRFGVPAIAVQHHHAHIAAVVAEHRVDAPVLGLALDGVGLGDDGAAWGGELLRVDGASCARLSHLRPLRLAGGDRAAREPWRMAAAALAEVGRGDEITQRFADEPAAPMVATMLARGVHAPHTTSMGRWFDAAAGLLGAQRRIAFEGQAAMRLEGLAAAHGAVASDRSLFAIAADGTLDLGALASRLADLDDARYGAALFHATLVDALAQWVAAAAARERLDVVACGGGVFLNAIVARGLRAALARRGLSMLEARAVPPSDGGLALGQAWVARRALEEL